MLLKKTQIMHHIQQYTTIYVFMIILFLTGIIFGAVIVNSMNFIQKQDLFFYLQQFFEQVGDDESPNNLAILKNSFFYHAKYLFLLFVLGLTVIGLPIVWILIFSKGLVIGFSVGFIVNQLGFKGLLLSSLSIAPQNLVIIPIYIIAGSFSMIFSITLISKLFSRKISQSILQPFGRYVLMFSILLLVSIVAATLEAYIANHAMQSFIKSFY